MKERYKQQQEQQSREETDGIAEHAIGEGPLPFSQEGIIPEGLDSHHHKLAHENGHVVGF